MAVAITSATTFITRCFNSDRLCMAWLPVDLGALLLGAAWRRWLRCTGRCRTFRHPVRWERATRTRMSCGDGAAQEKGAPWSTARLRGRMRERRSACAGGRRSCCLRALALMGRRDRAVMPEVESALRLRELRRLGRRL